MILLKSSGHCLRNPFERHGRKKIKIMRERRFGWGENKEFGAICGQTVKDWKMEGTLYSLFLTVVFTSHVLHDSRVENPLLPTIFEIQKYYFHFDLEFFTCITIYNFAHLTWYSSLPEIHDGGNESLINVELWRKKKEIERS